MNLPKLFVSHLLAPLVAIAQACGGTTPEVPKKPFSVVVQATTDEGQPMAGAHFTADGQVLGTTDANGSLTATIRGADGDSVEVIAHCPDGYVAPEHPSLLRLAEVRRIDATDHQGLGIDAICTRKMRDIMLVVRADGTPGLPVDVFGKNLGQTDASGYAHIALQLDRDVRRLDVSLNTQGALQLRPLNPSRTFELDGKDALVLLDQSFKRERPVVVRARKPVVPKEPIKHVPVRIE